MKKSELKKLIKECMREVIPEVLPELLMVVNEHIQQGAPSSSPSLVEDTRDEDRLSLIRSKFREANPESAHNYGLKAPKPKNPKKVVDGETFASGKGILEWFGDTKKMEGKANTDAKEKKMDEFMKDKFGV